MTIVDRAILIVEDETLNALDLSDTVEAAGDPVIGSFATIAQALAPPT